MLVWLGVKKFNLKLDGFMCNSKWVVKSVSLRCLQLNKVGPICNPHEVQLSPSDVIEEVDLNPNQL